MYYLCTFSFCICRPIDKVLGFFRETLAAVTSNIEGREWCHHSNQLGKPEHPQASTTDNVECFFSMMRDRSQLYCTISKAWISKRDPGVY